MNKNIVKKDNVLINASYTLTLAEQRLILLAIVDADGQPDALRDLQVHASAYADRFNVSIKTAYEAIQDATKNLFERRFSYRRLTAKGHSRLVVSRWVERVEYAESEGLVNLRFASDVIPLLCDLQNRFTYYGLEQVAHLTSVHAVRLYELLIAWRSTGKTPFFDIADFREKLGIEPHEYTRMANFKARVLDAAIAQINEHTDIFVVYEQHKRGRTVSGFTFTFKQKKLPCNPKIIDLIDGTVDAEKRQSITKAQAESLARPGETWPDLISRLSGKYCTARLRIK